MIEFAPAKRCKRFDVCGNHVAKGARYCSSCAAHVAKKQAEYEAVQATLRPCWRCGEKLSKTRHDANERLCANCEADQLTEDEYSAKLELLDSAESLDELKDWLRVYMVLR